MLMARIRRFVRNTHRPDMEDDVDDVAQGDVAMMWTLVVTPAKMDAHAVRWNVNQRGVQHFDMHLDVLAELRHTRTGKLDMSAHREVGAIDLEHEARPSDHLVFRFHRLAERNDIGLMR